MLAVCTLASISTVMTTDAIAVDIPANALRQDSQGALSLEAVDDDSGKPLPVRMRIVPAQLFRDERVRVERTGRIAEALDAGEYRVTVTHGPEWSVFEQTVWIEAGERAHVEARLRREVDASRYTACDLHVHTAESPDSNLELQERVSTLLAEDLQFAVVTDHNRVTSAVEALAAVGIGALPGVEVTTWDPELGHFNVFPRSTAPRYRHSSAHRLLRELRQSADSFVQINHPRLEGHIGYFELARFERTHGEGSHDFPLAFDGIEVWNGYDLAAPARRDEVFLDWLSMIARGQHITATGNSDSHKAGAAPYVGYPRTYVQVERSEAVLPGKVLTALKQGRAFVTNGPILNLSVLGKRPGDSLHLGQRDHSLSVRLEVSAQAWMELTEVELWLGTERVVVQPLRMQSRGRSESATLLIELPIQHQRSLVAVVRGRASMKPLLGRSSVTPYAFSNPIWLVRH